jgi:hypothetical protein
MTTPASRFVLLSLLAVVGCGSDTPTEPSTTTTTTATAVTETITSAVQRRGATLRSFTTSTEGNVTVSLTSLGQEGAAVRLGLGLSDEVSGDCSLAYTVVTTAYSGRQLAATADAGRYCVGVYDIGELTAFSTGFTITVVHY